MKEDIAVSYVVTVYNKEPYVGFTVDSLLQQEGDIAREYIFVDDASTDSSMAVVEERTQGIPNVIMIRNTVNAGGPSIRLNQGARLARGKYLQFIDSDDILAANATQEMLIIIERHQADLIHGGWERTNTESAKLLGRRVAENAPYIVSDNPKEFIFEQRFRRMSQMVKRETFLAAGGCDEGICIQDESLGLRLARIAKRFIIYKAPVLLIPKIENEFSLNVSQLNHDRFLANHNMLRDFPDLDERMRRQLFRRCISSAWKQQRLMFGIGALFKPIFWYYAQSKCVLLPVNKEYLAEMRDFFASLKGVRRAGNVR